jgi:DNA-binding beta-propeller fold protein YncE
MRRSITALTALAVALTLILALPAAATEAKSFGNAGEVVIADRASGTISVIDAGTDQLIGTFPLPPGDNPPEPMYVTYVKDGNHVFVGDRANDRVVVFDADDYSVVGTIAAGAGVFHQWADPRGRQLWVNNDIDNTATVIDPQKLSVLGIVDMPADLVAAGSKPHDVILDPKGRFAFVTLVGGGANDWLVKFDTATFTEVDRAEVGLDPHVSLTQRNRLIYVPAQNSDVVTVLDRTTLEPVTELAVPGAHGAAMTHSGKIFYTTNLPGGGTNGLFAIDTGTNTVIGSADTPYPVPHNIVVTKNDKLFLTHSGATSNKVTIYDVTTTDPIPELRGEVTVGFNPFGLAYVP